MRLRETLYGAGEYSGSFPDAVAQTEERPPRANVIDAKDHFHMGEKAERGSLVDELID